MHNTALSWLMYRLTHSEWMLGLMSLAATLPLIVLSPFAGAAADRFPRRNLVIATQTVLLVQALALAVLSFTGLVRPWHLLALGLVFGIAKAFEIPARQSLLFDMTGPDDLLSAIGLNSMIFNVARIVGPALGGIVLAGLGEGWCFLLNSLSFLAVLLGLFLMRLPNVARSEETASWSAVRVFLGSHPTALPLLVLCAGLNIGFSGVTVLNPFFAEDIFRQGPRGLGVLTSSVGVGALVGTYWVAKRTNPKELPRVNILGGALLGCAFAGYAASPFFLWSMLLLAAAGASLMGQNVAANSVLQSAAPMQLRGRVVSLFSISVMGMTSLGALLFGAIARQSTPRIATALSAGLCFGATLWARRRMAGALLLLWLCLAPAAHGQTARGQKSLERVDELLKETSRLTGFAIKRRVPAATMTKAELDRFLNRKLREDANPKAIATEELVLKRFGFAPPDFNLLDTTLALLGEQAAAFYDFEKKKLFVIDQGNGEIEPELLIHELGHALADQHFGLRKFLKGSSDDDDASLARMAVMEGQAMWLMAKYQPRSIPLSPPQAGEDNDFPVMSKVPLYLSESLIFPYREGLAFQAAVCEKHEDCLERVFRQPPRSSAQILHPELYFQGAQPETAPLPEAPPGGRWKPRAEGNLGEFDFELLMKTFRQAPEGVTEHWRGGAYRLLENKKTKDVLLQHASIWEDPASARRWFDAYAQILAAKWKSYAVQRRQEDSLEGTGDHGPFRLRIAGRVVTAEEGLPVK